MRIILGQLLAYPGFKTKEAEKKSIKLILNRKKIFL